MLQNTIILKEKVLLIPKIKIQVKIHYKILKSKYFGNLQLQSKSTQKI